MRWPFLVQMEPDYSKLSKQVFLRVYIGLDSDTNSNWSLPSRAQSSCEITLDDLKPGSSERIITIVGTPNGIQFAQQLMQNRSD